METQSPLADDVADRARLVRERATAEVRIMALNADASTFERALRDAYAAIGKQHAIRRACIKQIHALDCAAGREG